MSVLTPIRTTLEFMIVDWLDVDEDPATIDGLLDLSEALASDHFLPHHRLSDLQEPELIEGVVKTHAAIRPALAAYAEAGLFAAAFPEHLGGVGLPTTLATASFALFAAANLATAAFPMLTGANARLIATFGSPIQIDSFARPQIEGRWLGTMCLSEPQAGSSLGDILTRATPDGEDEFGPRYRISGNKMWISGGDHDLSENIVHLVLAKIPGEDGQLPAGSAGISLFIVPRQLPDCSRNDVAVAGLNHKLGYRGIPNCLLNFGERSGAVGWRIGKSGEGLKQMFHMMNEARIGVATGAAAVAMRGYSHALQYARERTQGRPLGVRDGPPVEIIAHADVRHLLLQQKCYAEGALALCLYAAALVEAREGALLAMLTPVVKTWASEFGLEANDRAIQVHGGYGYTRDFAVEQLWRDNRLNPIHEGTTAIQALDLVGRKLAGEGYQLLKSRIDDTLERSPSPALRDAWAKLDEAAAILRANPALAHENATSFLRAIGHGVVGWLWQDIALASLGDDDMSKGRRHAAAYFAATELPRIAVWLSPIMAGQRLAADMPDQAF